MKVKPVDADVAENAAKASSLCEADDDEDAIDALTGVGNDLRDDKGDVPAAPADPTSRATDVAETRRDDKHDVGKQANARYANTSRDTTRLSARPHRGISSRTRGASRWAPTCPIASLDCVADVCHFSRGGFFSF